ncbi:MAG: acetyltransferase [bacterium]|nr:acetyltransferase [bacterium]
MESLILLGAGTHAKACIDVIETEGRYKIKGILDQPDRVGEDFLGYQLIGTVEDLRQLAPDHVFLVSVGQHLMSEPRTFLYKAVMEVGGQLASPVSPLAQVSRHAQVGAGTLVLPHALVSAGAQVGVNCILGAGCLIEPDAEVGDHCHIGSGAILNAGAQVGNLTLVGSRTVFEGRIKTPGRSAVPIGSLVYRTQRGEIKVFPEGLKHEDH